MNLKIIMLVALFIFVSGCNATEVSSTAGSVTEELPQVIANALLNRELNVINKFMETATLPEKRLLLGMAKNYPLLDITNDTDLSNIFDFYTRLIVLTGEIYGDDIQKDRLVRMFLSKITQARDTFQRYKNEQEDKEEQEDKDNGAEERTKKIIFSAIYSNEPDKNIIKLFDNKYLGHLIALENEDGLTALKAAILAGRIDFIKFILEKFKNKANKIIKDAEHYALYLLADENISNYKSVNTIYELLNAHSSKSSRCIIS